MTKHEQAREEMRKFIELIRKHSISDDFHRHLAGLIKCMISPGFRTREFRCILEWLVLLDKYHTKCIKINPLKVIKYLFKK